MPDDEWGQRIAAVVVLREGARADAEALTSFARGELRGSKTPDVVSFATELPYTETGKLLRRQVLADLVADQPGTEGHRLMATALDGIKVLEVASWTFVPAAGAVLADWGADVIKVEHPVTGDPQRGLIAMGLIPGGDSAVNYIIEQPNRGKRSIGLDITTDHGRELLYRLARESDVFLTSFLPEVRQRLQIDVEHIQAVNPRIVYARGTGQGPKGPDAGKGGYDGAIYWGRGGVAEALTPECSEFPIGGRAAFGDLAGAVAIAGGITAALLKRERTGEAPVVDVSLLGFAMWQLSPDIVASGLYGGDPMPKFDHFSSPNPLVGAYKTVGRPLRHPDVVAVRPVLAGPLRARWDAPISSTTRASPTPARASTITES